MSDGDSRVLIDPFLSANPKAAAKPDELDPTHILLTHGHVDHVLDAVDIAKRTGAHCVGVVETAGWLGKQGVENVSDPNLGGTVELRLGLGQAGARRSTAPRCRTARSPTPAGWWSTSAARPSTTSATPACSGTCSLIAQRTPVDVALMPIGGHYTMDRHDAVVAAD